MYLKVIGGKYRMSIKKKIPFIFSLVVLVILTTFSTIHYIRWENKVMERYESDISMITREVTYHVNRSKETTQFIEEMMGRELRTASIAVKHMIDDEYENVTNEELVEIAKELMLAHITLFAKSEDDIIGVRSSDPYQIDLSTKEWGYWYEAFSQLFELRPVTVDEGQPLQNYWSGPIEIASSNPKHRDKWGYYYDGTTDFLINPYFRDEDVLDFERRFGPYSAIQHYESTREGLLELTVFNPNNFGKTEQTVHLNGNTYVRISEQPIWYGSYDYENTDKDAEHIKKAMDTKTTTYYKEMINGKEVQKSFVPVFATTGEPFVVGVSYDYSVIDDQIKEDLMNQICVSALFFVLVLIISVLLSKSLTRPISYIAETVNEITKGNFNRKIELQRNDELGRLATDVNQLSQHLKEYIDDLEESKAIIEHQAYHDPLTNLPNRRYVQENLQQLKQKAEVTGSNIALAFIDLDRFKQINDSLGHTQGDELICKMAKRIKQCFPPDIGIVARQGGDEFIILLDNMDQKTIEMRMNSLLSNLEIPVNLYGTEVYIRASIGIAQYPTDTTMISELLTYADMAMYTAKSKGGNRFVMYSKHMKNRSDEQLHIESRLRKAIEHNEIEAVYQPIFDVESNQVVGAEALVRWDDATLGPVSPGDFIPLAEDTGLITDVWEQVMRKALQQVAEWNKKEDKCLTVAVNFSAKQFHEPKCMVHKVKQLLSEFKVKPEWFEIEITESILMYDTVNTIKALQELQQYGVKISVDDFGTGYSSLSYLNTLPIDKLKIDQSFIQHIDENNNNSEIAEAIIKLAHTLKLEIIAEGVEKVHQKQFLISHHCNRMQGYLFAKPLKAFDFTAIL